MANSDFGRIAAGSCGAGPFDPMSLLDLAQAEAGMGIPLDDLARDGLTVLCADLTAHAASLNFMGKKLLQRALLETLLKRAYTDRTCSLGGEGTINPAPIFIIAPFRSGTTLLHRMMAQDPQFDVTATWQVSVSLPDPAQAEDAINVVATYLDRINKIAPDFQRLHPTGATLAEECFGLLEPSFLSPSFLFWASLPNYQQWLQARTATDWVCAYRRYANGLTALRSASKPAQLLLKSPFHLWGLEAVLDVFPDCKIVQLHREPADVMRSTSSLLAANRAIFARASDNSPAIEAANMMETALMRANAARAQAGPARFVDLRFDALAENPLATVRNLYIQLGLTMSDQAKTNMSTWLRDSPVPAKHAAGNKAPPQIPRAFTEFSQHAPMKSR